MQNIRNILGVTNTFITVLYNSITDVW